MKLIAISLLVVMQAGFIAQKTMSANLQKGSQTSSNESICIYPNPMQGKSIISFWVKQAGNTHINAYSIDGRKVISTSENLQKGKNTFQLSLPKGVYMIQVAGNGLSYSTKVINPTSNKIKPELVFAGVDNTETPLVDDSQNTTSINSMGVPGNSNPIGSSFQGGKIVCVYGPGDSRYLPSKCRGVIIGNTDLVTATWGCQGTLIPIDSYNNYMSTFEYGNTINNVITTNCSTAGIAAAVCRDYTTEGYSGWYLPSYSELLNYTNTTTSIGSFTNSYYWTSTQVSSTQAVSFHFGLKTGMNSNKSEYKYVRPVRTFSIDIPSVTTTGASSITGTTAVCGSNISSDGGTPIVYRGICWSTSTNPTKYSSTTYNTPGIGSISNTINNLMPNTTYYVRAFTITLFGTYYGNEVSFKTITLPPTLTTNAVSAITTSSANGGGNISSDGGASVTERGVCWSTSANPTIANSKTSNGTGTGLFTSSITGLTSASTYYVRAYATNSVGTAYGNQISFKTAFAPGDSYEGGIIAYIFVSGDPGYDENVQHGLIAAPSDQKNNNNSLMDWNAALSVCNNLVLNNKDDWRLPILVELKKLYLSRNLIGGFSTGEYDHYWSSSTNPNNSDYAICILMGSGSDFILQKNGQVSRVRAVRNF